MLAGYECLRLTKATHVVLPLALAYHCGQAFRWRQVHVRPDPQGPSYFEWSLCIHDRVVFLVHDVDQHCLYYRTMPANGSPKRHDTAAWLWDYLNLNAPTSTWYQEWCERDPIFAKHAKRFAGMSILRQDPWECMCAYVGRHSLAVSYAALTTTSHESAKWYISSATISLNRYCITRTHLARIFALP